MRHPKLALLAVVAVAATAVPAAPALAHDGRDCGGAPGTRSLVELLGRDGVGFDSRWSDFDIVEAAAFAVLAAKPSSPVGLLADGSAALTAFLPTDRAFRDLVEQLTGTRPATEQETFDAVAGLGIDTVEAVLLYHVLPGATVGYRQALRAHGQPLTMASGGTVTVSVRHHRVTLVDADLDDQDARVLPQAKDLNRGNLQVAHGVSSVLRPLDLP